MSRTKIMMKVHTPKGLLWRHFCYIPTPLVTEFELKTKKSLGEAIRDWVKSDCGITLSNIGDLKKAKGMIKSVYKSQFPDLFLDTDIDSQGWVRYWVIGHIKEELEI